MNKNVLYIGLGLGAAGLGYLLYRFMQTPTQAYSTTSLNPNSNPQAGSQTSYPFTPGTPARVDNSNQPWANNNRAAIAQIGAGQIDVNLSNTQMIAGYAKSAADISSSLTSLWEDLDVGSWFDSGDSEQFSLDMDYGSNDDWFGGDTMSTSENTDWSFA